MGGSGGSDILRKATRWCGCVASVLVFALGLVHIIDIGAKLKWPDNKFTDDVNSVYWRFPLFTFLPDTFADVWTPVFMGLFGALWHFEHLEWKTVMKSFITYFLFMFLMAMFGCIGYNGGLGILFSIPCFLCCLGCIVCYFLDSHSEAGLKFDRKFQSHAA